MSLTAIAVHPSFSKSEQFIHMECVTMAPLREQLAREAAARGKYAPLYRHLAAKDGPRWRYRLVRSRPFWGSICRPRPACTGLDGRTRMAEAATATRSLGRPPDGRPGRLISKRRPWCSNARTTCRREPGGRVRGARSTSIAISPPSTWVLGRIVLR